MRNSEVERVGDGCRIRHHHHVRSRNHDLPSNGVTKLDDRLDEFALLVFDDLILSGGLDDAEKLLLAHEWAAL